ncbi:MAG: RHS repeat-associated core domain-containing protein [Bacteroidota bacterium]
MDKEEPVENLVTWVFEEGTFVPEAKITEEGTYPIISDYLGTPVQAFDSDGNQVWERELDIYGNARHGDNTFCPFTWQGQYFDEETGLAYNRFRYYNPETGVYISKDPIGLAGSNPNIYAYVNDSNKWVDPLGLAKRAGNTSFVPDALHPNTVTPDNPGGIYEIEATGTHRGDKMALYKEAGLKESFSDDYVAHHVSYDPETNTMQMQLVKTDDHAMSHVGGVNDFNEHHGIDKYNTEASKEKAKQANMKKGAVKCK